MPERPRVELVGTFCEVAMWYVADQPDQPFAVSGEWRGTILGNDAVIAARHLDSRGCSLHCQLLDPTQQDQTLVRTLLAPTQVSFVGASAGTYTRSLCIESASGVRSWVFSRIPCPLEPLAATSAEIVYADFYPELRTRLETDLPRILCSDACAYINLGVLASPLPSLPTKGAIVQGSLSSHLLREDALAFVDAMRKTCDAQCAIVTLGSAGAAMAISGGVWHYAPSKRLSGSILGAGAVFSAEVVLSMLEGLDGEELLVKAVESTASELNARRNASGSA